MQTAAYGLAQDSRTVQQYVKGEESSARGQESEISAHTTEPSLAEETELAEALHKGEVKPTPTVEQRRYSVDWDPLQ